MATPTVYVICDQNCKFEGMTKEQILTAIAQAVESGEITDVDAGFVTTLKTINGQPLKFFVGEQSEYETLTAEDKENLFAIITNDTTKEGLLNSIAQLTTDTEQNTEDIIKIKEAFNVVSNWLNTVKDNLQYRSKLIDFDKGFNITSDIPHQLMGNYCVVNATIEVVTKHHGILKLYAKDYLNVNIPIETGVSAHFYSRVVGDYPNSTYETLVRLNGNLQDSENYPFVILKIFIVSPNDFEEV